MTIEIKNLSKQYNNILAVKNINFKINKGSIVGLLGPNGCGKTTTIGMMLGLIKPTSGTVFINGLNIENENNRTKILEMETKKQELRTNLFSNQKLIIFFMVFPIIISSILVYFLKAYVFASFIILMWYGMILAFYFSQSDALTKLIEVFKREKRNT